MRVGNASLPNMIPVLSDSVLYGAGADATEEQTLGLFGGDVAALGFSWGGAVCFVAGRYAWCCCGAAAHSTLSCFSLRGSSPTEAAALVKCPQMLLQSGADPDATKRGSALQEALPGASVLDDYPAMKHGFLLRGDRVVIDAPFRSLRLSARLSAFCSSRIFAFCSAFCSSRISACLSAARA